MKFNQLATLEGGDPLPLALGPAIKRAEPAAALSRRSVRQISEFVVEVTEGGKSRFETRLPEPENLVSPPMSKSDRDLMHLAKRLVDFKTKAVELVEGVQPVRRSPMDSPEGAWTGRFPSAPPERFSRYVLEDTEEGYVSDVRNGLVHFNTVRTHYVVTISDFHRHAKLIFCRLDQALEDERYHSLNQALIDRGMQGAYDSRT